MTRRKALGPWLKLYGDVIERKAAYTDAQFRALIEAWTWALRGTPRGTLPSRRNVAARLGVDNVDFLFAEGDLVEGADGVLVEGWDVYQAGVLSTGRGSKADGGDVVEQSANSSRTVHELSANVVPLPLRSIEKDEEKNDGVDLYGGDDPDDPLNRFAMLTRMRPWGQPTGRWLHDLEERHGRTALLAAMEVEARAGNEGKLLGRVADRLAKQADRAEQAAKGERVAAEVVHREQRAATVKPEDAAMRAALEATGRYGPRVDGGLTKVGDVMLESASDGSARTSSPTVTSGEVPDRESLAAATRAVAESTDRTPSPGGQPPSGFGSVAEPSVAGTAVRLNGATVAPKPKE